jgi:hypothetical protein
MPETTDKKQDTRFKPGQSGNPAGRPKGSRNKVSEKLLEALAIDFDAHGKEVIEKVRADRPADYLTATALAPRQTILNAMHVVVHRSRPAQHR